MIKKSFFWQAIGSKIFLTFLRSCKKLNSFILTLNSSVSILE
jgi:hypothetical protein